MVWIGGVGRGRDADEASGGEACDIADDSDVLSQVEKLL